MEDNTSCLPDEMLAHRLGLIPIKADPRRFEFPASPHFEEPTEEDTVVFTLDVTCTVGPDGKKLHDKVYSGDLVWEPQGEQEETFQDAPIRPVHDDILITQLQPGQRLKCRLYCCKGIGQDHAKFSPVCTAAYRMHPKITLARDVTGADAKDIKRCCPRKVFDVAGKKLVVKSPRQCTMCGECVRDARSELVKLGRVEDHFLFTVESTGIYDAKDIFLEALEIMKQKAAKIIEMLDK